MNVRSEILKLLIAGVSSELRKPLPGKTFQYKMAPADRDKRYSQNINDVTPKQAAVMILLLPLSSQVSAVFVKRTVYPGAHSGQVSFPGGTFTDSDSGLFQTAKRETEEELGIDLHNLIKLGALTPLFIGISNFMVYPFVGLIGKTSPFNVQTSEIQYAFTVSLATLQDKKARSQFEVRSNGYAFPAPCYLAGKEKIWGATAMILSEFLEVINRAKISLKI